MRTWAVSHIDPGHEAAGRVGPVRAACALAEHHLPFADEDVIEVPPEKTRPDHLWGDRASEELDESGAAEARASAR